eukprot:554572_1
MECSVVWSEEKVDGHVVDAKYVAPIDIDDKKEKFPHKYDEKWAAKHIKHGQYHLSIMKCSDPICCSNIKSNIHDILPDDQYPAPKYFIQDKGVLSFGTKHQTLPKDSHYASYQMICTLNKGFPHNEPNDCHDDFNPSLTAEALGDTKCRVCLKWFPSKKLMLSHRRHCHPRSRENNIEDVKDNDNYEMLLTEAEQQFYDNIVRICDDRNGQYLAVMGDDTQIWVVLGDEDAKVKEYLVSKEALPADAHKVPDITNIREWNMCPWIPNESYEIKEEEDSA